MIANTAKAIEATKQRVAAVPFLSHIKALSQRFGVKPEWFLEKILMLLTRRDIRAW